MARTIFGDFLEGVVEVTKPLKDLANDVREYAKDVKEDAKDCLKDMFDK